MWLSWGLFGVRFRWLEGEEKLRCRNVGVRVGGWCPTNDECLGPEFLVYCVNVCFSGSISTVLYMAITYTDSLNLLDHNNNVLKNHRRNFECFEQ